MATNQDFGIYITSNRPAMAEEVKKSLLPYNGIIFNGDGYLSFSHLFNHCVEQSPYEYNIIIGDKAIATDATINFIINGGRAAGYALVAACGFACVGFHKDLFRKIGPLDERFIGGSFEDSDYLTRLKHANLAFSYSWECHHIKSPSSWAGFEQNKQKYIEKWGTDHIHLSKRILPDEYKNYDFGPESGIDYKWLDFTHTLSEINV